MHIVIIGNGIAGITTARYVRKYSDHEITVISAESDYFWSRTALMYVYMGHMKFEHTQPYENQFWEKNRINLLSKYVSRIDPEQKALHLSDGESLAYDKLVLATGSQTNKFGWPGQDLDGVQGMVSKQDLDALEARSEEIKRAVIVGGGLIGIELAEMLHSRHIPVTFLVREESFWSNALPAKESALVTKEVQRTEGIDLQLQTELKEILADENGKVRAVRTSKGEEISCEFVGLTAGVHANTDLAKEAGIEAGRGFLVDEYLQTNVPDIYAAGDCAELRNPASGRRGVEAVWYTGKHMGPILAKTLIGETTRYQQPLWFNSAKFIDMEYQVYGTVNAHPGEEELSLYWQHPTEHKAIRLVYEKDSHKILGFNLMGIRFRQETCLAWIAAEAHIETVLTELKRANFDPEFFPQYEAELAQVYAKRYPDRPLIEQEKHSVAGLIKSIGLLSLVAIALIGVGFAFSGPAGPIVQGIGGFILTVALVRGIEFFYQGFSKGFGNLQFSRSK